VARVGRIVSIALITAGLVILLDVGLTLAYREPISSIYGSIKQHAAANELADLESHYPTRADLRAIEGVRNAEGKIRVLARRFARQAEDGEAIGRIVAPAMGDLSAVIVEGTGTGSLQKGPGHYSQTPFPGQPGTVAIAGHRTTYLAPFRHIDSLEIGDEIDLELPYAGFTYTVEGTDIVEPGDVQIINPVGYDRLVLTACHPLYSAAQRYVIFAKLTRIDTFASSGEEYWPAS
jgi:sortase A